MKSKNYNINIHTRTPVPDVCHSLPVKSLARYSAVVANLERIYRLRYIGRILYVTMSSYPLSGAAILNHTHTYVGGYILVS